MTTVSETIPGLARERALVLYREMVVIRRTEEALARAHAAGLVHGACHTYVGEEAVAVGVSAHLRLDDTVLSTHRGHGHALAKGVPPRALMAELFGRVTGCSHGRGGSMHLFAPEVGLLGTSGIVGPSIVMATGAGYSHRLLTDVGVARAVNQPRGVRPGQRFLRPPDHDHLSIERQGLFARQPRNRLAHGGHRSPFGRRPVRGRRARPCCRPRSGRGYRRRRAGCGR